MRPAWIFLISFVSIVAALALVFATFCALAASEHRWDPEPQAYDGYDEPTDMVITWVDTGDRDWFKRFTEAKARQTGDHDIVTNHVPHVEVEEVEFAVRLARTNLPWLRTIHVLTQRPQCPKFMREQTVRDELGLKLVHHDECGLKEPTYSGMVVSTLPCSIPGLAEHYVRMDDDVFITQPLPLSHFFDQSGRPILRCAWHPLPAPLLSLWPWWKDYTEIRITTHRALRRIVGKPLYRQLDMSHRPWPTNKSLERRALEAAAEEVANLGPVRSSDDIDFGALFSINWMVYKTRDEVILRPTSGLRNCSASDLPEVNTGINSINTRITDAQRNALETLVSSSHKSVR